MSLSASRAASASSTEHAPDHPPAILAASDQARALAGLTAEAWLDQGRTLFASMIGDGVAAFEALRACRSPLDILLVEQAWLSARSAAYLGAGTDLVVAGLQAADGVAARPLQRFVLPD